MHTVHAFHKSMDRLRVLDADAAVCPCQSSIGPRQPEIIVSFRYAKFASSFDVGLCFKHVIRPNNKSMKQEELQEVKQNFDDDDDDGSWRRLRGNK